MITYRQAKFDDVENIHKLLNDYAKEGLMLPRSRNAIYENLRDYIVAVQGSHLVGCGALHFVWDRLAEIRSLAVDPELKCTGIGKKLVELLEKAVEEYNIDDEVVLSGSFCIGKCNRIGVTVQVNDDVHVGVTRENFREFFKKNILDVIESEGK